MAAAQATQPRAPVAGVSLVVVLIAAKVIAVAGHMWPPSPWAPLALMWPDVAVALAFVAVELLAPLWLATAAYVVAVTYVVVNVPVTHALGTPMTPSMWRAAGFAMRDSAAHALDWSTVVRMAGVASMGVVARLGLRRRPLVTKVCAAVLVPLLAGGLVASGRVDTAGLERNAFTALRPIPVVAAERATTEDLRATIVSSTEPHEDLRSLAGSARGLNVIVVVLESTAAEYLRTYGAKDDPTPNLTVIGRRAVVFDSAYASYPESIREIFAWLCGREPRYGATTEDEASAPCNSIAQRLGTGGYRTALFHSGRFDYLGMRAAVASRGFDTLEDAGAIGGTVHSSFGVDESSTVDRLLDWIDADRSAKPFFAAYLPIAGHHPYATTAPGPFDAASDAGRYLNAIHEGDAALGRLLEGLHARRLDDRVALVIFGDHGEAFGQHDGNTGHSLFAYDENVRVPLMLVVPGAPPVRIQRPVSIADVAPTIADLAGLPPISSAGGVSLLDPAPRVAFFFTDYSRPWVGARDGCWKYLFDVESRRSRLFDVCRDPGETHDRSSEHVDLVARFHARTMEWLGRGAPRATRSGQPPSGSSSRRADR